MNLDYRIAKCTMCGSKRFSIEKNLAFFEYRGEGSKYATEFCSNCHYYKSAHETENTARSLGHVCKEFTPAGPAEHDLFYDGCRGWD